MRPNPLRSPDPSFYVLHKITFLARQVLQKFKQEGKNDASRRHRNSSWPRGWLQGIIHPLLCELHWLPVESQLRGKVLVLTFKTSLGPPLPGCPRRVGRKGPAGGPWRARDPAGLNGRILPWPLPGGTLLDRSCSYSAGQGRPMFLQTFSWGSKGEKLCHSPWYSCLLTLYWR